MKPIRILVCLALIVSLAACAFPPLAVAPARANPNPTLSNQNLIETAVASITVPPTLTPPGEALPTATETPQPSLTPTYTPTPTLFPLSIDAMRQRDYPGSEITLEQVLDAGANYSRYIASYYSEGLKIYSLLTIPFGDPPESGWPVVVFNHGYIPPDVYVTTERYVAYVDAFAARGYIVIKPDYRGHGNSDGPSTGAYSNPGYVVDVLNALSSIRRFPQADPDRVGMWGHSMGGYITLRAMVISPDIKAGVIWGGVVASYPDMLTRWRATPPSTISSSARGWRSSFINQFGSPEENPAFWQSISANSYLDDLSGPLQLHHGEADESVPAVFSQLLYNETLAAGKTVELYIYPENNHNIAQSFSAAMQRSIGWFDYYVKGQ